MITGSQRGQASVEVVGMLPALLALGLALFQLAAIGYSMVLAANAAEAAALAVAAGGDATQGARHAVPGWSRAGLRVEQRGGEVRVRLRPPSPVRQVSDRVEVRSRASVVLP